MERVSLVDDLKADLASVKAHMGEMESSQRMTLREIAGLKSGAQSMQEGMQSMQEGMQSMQAAMGAMQTAMVAMQTHMAGMQISLQSTEASVDRLWTHVEHLHQATMATRGTFASIERHMVRLFEEQSETRCWRAALEARVDALEKRQPPAA